ncbi:MAG: VWA domain-containing protein [Myxococcales bacterium]|nr:VWA domain-containing protein [Myxococcales bacterium]
MVPAPEDISVEGLLNEHDMPIVGEPCVDVVCVNLAAGTGRVDAQDQSSIFLQVGYDTAINGETWERPATEFTVVIDVSGSMSELLKEIKLALRVMESELTAEDTIAIVAYGDSAQLVLPPTRGDQRDEIDDAISNLSSGGSTNMEAGLQRGYETARQMATGRNARVLLFTDEQPNTGSTSAGTFKFIIGEGANDNIGLTMFGIGDAFGSGLAYEIGELRGGNLKYLAAEYEIEHVFTEAFGYLVTPVAYDLNLQLSSDAALEAAYNVQSSSASGGGTDIEVHVATLFLSEGHGASVLQLAAGGRSPSDVEVAYGELSFETTGGDIVSIELAGDMGTAAGGYGEDAFGQVGTRNAALLVNEALTAIEICEAFHHGSAGSVAGLARVTEARLRAEAEALDDDALRRDVDFFAKLLTNAGI